MKKLNKLLALVLAMVMTLSLSVTALGAWYDEAVAYVTENGLMDKVSETDFAPNTNADRATVVVALYRLAGSPEVTAENPFTDVAADASYYNAVVWAFETGVTTGTSDTTFGPTELVTRQQFAAFLQRYTKNCGNDVTVAEDFTLDKFSDAASVQSYAVEPVRWACSLGLIQGSGDKLLPRDNTTRAQLATIVMRYAEMDFEAAEETEKPSIPATLAEQIAEANKLDNKEFLAYESTITGVITDDPQASSRAEGSYKFTVSDGTNTLLCYFVPVTGGTPKKGDTVTVTGKLTAYNGAAQFSEDQAAATWVSAGAETETEEPKTEEPETTEPVDVAKAVKIYYAAEDKYLSDKPAEKSRLAGVSEAEATVWTVEVDENGYYIFISDGKYLTSGATGNSMSMESTLTDCARWEVIACDGGVYLRNVGANYNGKYNQYMEFYYDFTTYGFNESKAGIYTFQLIEAE